MRRIGLALVMVVAGLAMVATAGRAQTAAPPTTAAPTETAKAPEPATAIERFMARRGTLLIIDHYSVGTIQRRVGNILATLEVRVVVATSPPLTDKVYGVELRDRSEILPRLFGFVPPLNTVGYMDMDEAKEALEAVRLILSLGTKMAGETHEDAQVVYQSSAGIRFGFIQRGRDQESTGLAYNWGIDGLAEFANLLQQAVDRVSNPSTLQSPPAPEAPLKQGETGSPKQEHGKGSAEPTSPPGTGTH